MLFVGVLFAAVITKTLDLSSADGLPAAGAAHLILAAVLVITSWIGYHNSTGRSTYRIEFFNLPLAQFSIEMTHVYLFWLVATTAETAASRRASAIPETVLLVVVFALFMVWDQVALAMRRSERYTTSSMREDHPERRRVTNLVFLFIFGLSVVVLIVDPRSPAAVIAIDAVLGLCLIAHRAVQNLASDLADKAATRRAAAPD
ncbi:hypothetical protein [Glycomyces salinus]|uniref:hypothetical protein n=1 Tax=Glycomyces salinus TaxID=980294 RepID=UPI0018EAA335|nr:hypothetical protein [Glycomyces salinus]